MGKCCKKYVDIILSLPFADKEIKFDFEVFVTQMVQLY